MRLTYRHVLQPVLVRGRLARVGRFWLRGWSVAMSYSQVHWPSDGHAVTDYAVLWYL